MSQRIYKFRAWDKENKRMWWNVQNAYDTLGNHHTEDQNMENEEMADVFFPSNFGEVLESENLVVMQFTGLKDKNGKEIFCGDILAGTDHSKSGEVKWNESEARYKLYIPQEKSFGLEYAHARLIEIIGNIHENPEFLTP